ncbi:hypothetical protein BH23CHL9_BH23CHL9_05080 [soil metagenome]
MGTASKPSMAAIAGAIATVLALILLLLRRIFRVGELGTAEDEVGEPR